VRWRAPAARTERDQQPVADRRVVSRRRLIELADDVWRTDEWDREYGELIDRGFIDAPWLESRADRISSYDAMYVPACSRPRSTPRR
jgi:hypothetical protein